MSDRVFNVVVAGLGGQGVIKASDILADAAFRAGYDVKKAEIHGMSQRGGSVSSDVRFGTEVLSPMVPPGEADILVVQAPDQIEANRARLRADGLLITPDDIDIDALANKRSANVAMMGVVSRHLPIADEHWRAAIKANLAEPLWEANLAAFDQGQSAS